MESCKNIDMTIENREENLLKAAIGDRLRETLKASRVKIKEAAAELGTPEPTLNRWLSGIHYPNMEALVRFSVIYKVSLDWILTGQESLLPKDQRESDFIIHYRSLVDRGVAEPLEAFMEHQLASVRAKDKSKALRVQAGKAFHLDTFGKRLRYVRKSQEGQTPAQMAERINLTERDYLKIERDELLPGTRVLTALASILMDEETRDQSIIDWLLEG